MLLAKHEKFTESSFYLIYKFRIILSKIYDETL